jgi:hypothetical protein
MMKRLITSVLDGHIPEDSRYAWVKDDVEKVGLHTHGLDTHSGMDLHIGHYGGEDRTDRQDSREGVHSGHPMGHHEMVHGQEEERNDRVGRSSRVVESDGGTHEPGYTHDVESRSSHRDDQGHNSHVWLAIVTDSAHADARPAAA